MNKFSFNNLPTNEELEHFNFPSKTLKQRLCFILEHNCPWIAVESNGRKISQQPPMTLEVLLDIYYSRLHFEPVVKNIVLDVEDEVTFGDDVEKYIVQHSFGNGFVLITKAGADLNQTLLGRNVHSSRLKLCSTPDVAERRVEIEPSVVETP